MCVFFYQNKNKNCILVGMIKCTPPICRMPNAQFRLRYAEEVNYCPPGGGSQQPRRALRLKAHTTSGLSPFHLPSALKAEVVSAATAKHDTQGLGGGCRQPLNHISKTEAISDWGWEFFVGSA